MTRSLLRIILACIAMPLLSIPAHAGLFRAYVSSTGNDANACTLQAPCRLLPAALAAISDGGEIWMLDSANYNTAPVNIAKSVSILAIPGAVGSVLAINGNAIDIATAGVKIALRNLVIVPFPGGNGTNGVNMTNGASLTVEGCLIANLPQSGIVVNIPASVRVTDTTIRDNGGTGLLLGNGAHATGAWSTFSGNLGDGVAANGTSALAATTVDIADSTINGNGYGIVALSGAANAVAKASVRHSQIAGNTNYGVTAQSTSGAACTISVGDNIISNNGAGIGALYTNSKIWASGNIISDNNYGLYTDNAGIIESAGTNAVRNNASNKTGTINVIATE